MTVTISKEAYDDYKRFKRDQEANSQIYDRLTITGVEKVPSSDLEVGDLVYVHRDQRVPADMILLRSSERSGGSFIRTDQLDGETDWKLRLAVPVCQKLPSDESILHMPASIYGKC